MAAAVFVVNPKKKELNCIFQTEKELSCDSNKQNNKGKQLEKIWGSQ